jgi:hypothetical protein
MAKRTITEITCPNCNYVISLDEAIIKPLEEKTINQIKKEAKQEALESYEKEKQNLAEKIKNKTLEEHRLKDKKKDKIISDLQKQLEKMQRKAEQSSQKLTGDILELDIIDILGETFHFDQIDKIKSGARGADILQKVCTKMGKSCGTIIIESKNAQRWSDSWISKLRKDQRDSKAEIAVLCSTVLPEDVKNLTLRDNIIIVHRKTLIPVIMILRNQLFEVDRRKNYNVDMNEKKQVLYNYRHFAPLRNIFNYFSLFLA